MLILFRANITVFVDYTQNTNLAPPNLGLMVIQLRQACNKILEALDEHKRLSTRLESLGPDDESNSTTYQVLPSFCTVLFCTCCWLILQRSFILVLLGVLMAKFPRVILLCLCRECQPQKPQKSPHHRAQTPSAENPNHKNPIQDPNPSRNQMRKK